MYCSNFLRTTRSFVKSASKSSVAVLSGHAGKPTSLTPAAPASASAPVGSALNMDLRKKVLKKLIKKVKHVEKPAQQVPATAKEGGSTPTNHLSQSAFVVNPAASPTQDEAPQPTAKPSILLRRPVVVPRKEQKVSPPSPRPEPEQAPDLPLQGEVETGDKLRRQLRGVAPESAPDPEQGPGPVKKTALVKGYRIEEVATLCGPSDAMFARRLPAGGCQFFAWPGTPLRVASEAIASMPDTIRTVHAVFGRADTPIDLVLDLDCPVPPEHWSLHKVLPFQRKVLDDVLGVVTEELGRIGEQVETQVVLQSPNLKKASFHVHTKLKDAAFADYESLHGFLARFHAKIPIVDLQIYRKSGMLRMFRCMKENHTSPMVVFDTPRWNIGFPDGKVPDAAAALHSVVVREAGTFSRKLTFDPPRASDEGLLRCRDDDGGQTAMPVRLPAVLIPRTEREAVETASAWLRQATELEVSEWRSWIGLGISAFRIGYHFRDAAMGPGRRPAMEEMLDAWREASQHCPAKYRHGDCERSWNSFDINKLGTKEGWWRSYRRLGRLERPAREALRREAEKAAQMNFSRGGSSETLAKTKDSAVKADAMRRAPA